MYEAFGGEEEKESFTTKSRVYLDHFCPALYECVELLNGQGLITAVCNAIICKAQAD
jgi:hypothetical protein